MRIGALSVFAVLALLAAGSAVRSVHPGRMANEEQRELLGRAHRAMHRRPVLLFAVPILVLLSTVVEQAVGVATGGDSPFEFLFPVIVVAIVLVVRVWRWPQTPSTSTG